MVSVQNRKGYEQGWLQSGLLPKRLAAVCGRVWHSVDVLHAAVRRMAGGDVEREVDLRNMAAGLGLWQRSLQPAEVRELRAEREGVPAGLALRAA